MCRDYVPPSDELKGETETSPAEEKQVVAVVVLGKKGADDLRCHSRSCGKAQGTGGGGMFPKPLHPHCSEIEKEKRSDRFRIHMTQKTGQSEGDCPVLGRRRRGQIVLAIVNLAQGVHFS